MTKLNKMDLPNSVKKGGKGMHFCEKCKEWVPEKNKHNKKHHNG